MGDYLTTAATLLCAHGGSVTGQAAAGAPTLSGSSLLTSADTFLISGCAFNVAGSPHPCVQVQWAVDSARGSASAAVLTTDSVGLCKAGDGAVQGPVTINPGQIAAGGL